MPTFCLMLSITVSGEKPCASIPTASITASGPIPPVMSIRASSTRVCLKSMISAPSCFASASRRGYSSMAITFDAPMTSADWIANRPTGPQPQTATTSPSEMSAFSAPIQPVGRMSDRNSTLSSSSPSGITMGPVSENGTRTYSACPPG